MTEKTCFTWEMTLCSGTISPVSAKDLGIGMKSELGKPVALDSSDFIVAIIRNSNRAVLAVPVNGDVVADLRCCHQ